MKNVLLELKAGVATITLNRPDNGNAIDIALAEELLEAAEVCQGDRSLRAVVLTGAGSMFCSGNDVKAMSADDAKMVFTLNQITAPLHAAIGLLSRMHKPLVTAVNGAAAGEGMSLAILGDIVIAARSAYFRAAYPGVGLSPDAGMSFLLPRLVGLRRAQQILLLNGKVGADRALEIGLVTEVVDDASLREAAGSVAATLAAMPTRALARTRHLLLASNHSTLEGHLELEARAIAKCVTEPDAREGLLAFRDKRTAAFRGTKP